MGLPEVYHLMADRLEYLHEWDDSEKRGVQGDLIGNRSIHSDESARTEITQGGLLPLEREQARWQLSAEKMAVVEVVRQLQFLVRLFGRT